MIDLTKRHCIPCEGGTPPLSDEKEDEMLKELQHDNGWILLRDGTHRITKQFKFEDFKKAMEFVNKIADLAESEGHHPDIKIAYNKVGLDLFTHAVGGLSENDFIMAAKIIKLEPPLQHKSNKHKNGRKNHNKGEFPKHKGIVGKR